MNLHEFLWEIGDATPTPPHPLRVRDERLERSDHIERGDLGDDAR